MLNLVNFGIFPREETHFSVYYSAHKRSLFWLTKVRLLITCLLHFLCISVYEIIYFLDLFI